MKVTNDQVKILKEYIPNIEEIIAEDDIGVVLDAIDDVKNNFADAPITALYKVSENHRQKIEEELYAAANEDRAIDREIIDYYVRKGAISEHKSENNQKDYTFDQRGQNDNADYRPAGKQYNRTGDSGKSAEYEVGYKGGICRSKKRHRLCKKQNRTS